VASLGRCGPSAITLDGERRILASDFCGNPTSFGCGLVVVTHPYPWIDCSGPSISAGCRAVAQEVVSASTCAPFAARSESQLEQQFVDDPLFAPQHVLAAHTSGQLAQLLRDRRSTGAGPHSPEQSPAGAMPADHRRRLHDHQGAAPIEGPCQQRQADAGSRVDRCGRTPRSMYRASCRRRKSSARPSGMECLRSTQACTCSDVKRALIAATLTTRPAPRVFT
jgi:hypothetical protein